MRSLRLTLTAWGVLLVVAAPAGALTIDLTFKSGTSASPSFDPNGLRISAIMVYAAKRWEDIIEDEATLKIEFYYSDLPDSPSTLGRHTNLDTSGGKPTKARIQFDTVFSGNERLWYFDPTPGDDSEYNMTQTLYRDLTNTQKNNWFTGSPPDLLEVGYRGSAPNSAPDDAQNGNDILSTAIHEIGHAVGLTQNVAAGEVGDGFYDVNPDFVRGATMGIGDNSFHIAPRRALMCSGCGATGLRRRPTATDVFAAAAAAGWTQIDLPRQDLLGGVDWSDPANWEGNQVPGGADEVFVRDSAAVVITAAEERALNVLIAENSAAFTGDNLLDVQGRVTIEPGDQGGTWARLYVGGVADDGELSADSVQINDGGSLIHRGGRIDANDINIEDGATLKGYGRVALTGFAPKLRNDGVIAAGHSSKMLRFTASDSLAFDLDGDSEDGLLEAILGDLRFESSLTDPFDSKLTVAAGRTASFLDGWSLGKFGVVELNGGPVDVARIQTGLWDLRGRVQVSGKTQVDTDEQVVVKPFADVNLVPNATLKMTGATRFEGGAMTLADNAILEITGQTTIEGGNFNVGDDARLVLSGPTAFEGGGYFGTGTMVQNGDATFKTNTIVNVETYDWDGARGGNSTTTVWPGVVLTINAKQIEVGFFDGHDEKITLDGGILSVHTTDSWRLDGVLELKQQDFFTPAIYGQRMVVRGSILALGDATIFSEVSFAPTASVLVNGGKILTLDGDVTFSGGSYNGFGTLRQNGDAIVLGDTQIGMSTYDMDGQSGSAHTTILDGVKLTMNVGHLDTNGSDQFDGTLHIAGELEVHNQPNAWTMDGVIYFDHGVVSGAPVVVSGEVYGDGTFDTDVGNIGLLSPGGSPGQISVLGSYDQGPAGVLDLEIGGPVPVDEHDRVWISGNAAFDGTLNLIFVDLFAPKAGQTFELIRVDGLVSGDFAAIHIVGLAPGFEYTAKFERGVLVLRAVNDGRIIPEPASAVLLGIGALSLLRRRRRR